MTVKEAKFVSVDEQKKLSPQERRILQRYGTKTQPGESKRKFRSIHELYHLRYKSKFR